MQELRDSGRVLSGAHFGLLLCLGLLRRADTAITKPVSFFFFLCFFVQLVPGVLDVPAQRKK